MTARRLTPDQLEYAIQQRMKLPPMPWDKLCYELGIGRPHLKSLLPPEARGKCRGNGKLRIFSPEECAEMARVYATEPGISLRRMAERYDIGENTLAKLIRSAGGVIRGPGETLGPDGKIVYPGAGGHRPKGDAPIGKLPPGHELAALDAAIMRARLEAGLIDGRRRPSRLPLGLGSSSLANA